MQSANVARTEERSTRKIERSVQDTRVLFSTVSKSYHWLRISTEPGSRILDEDRLVRQSLFNSVH